MRMLLGRQSKSANFPANIIDFNVEKEYEANEQKRLAGELAPEKEVVRSIKPGKHQLSSLLNGMFVIFGMMRDKWMLTVMGIAAQSQKVAFDEHFATGKRNKKEAGARYGW